MVMQIALRIATFYTQLYQSFEYGARYCTKLEVDTLIGSLETSALRNIDVGIGRLEGFLAPT